MVMAYHFKVPGVAGGGYTGVAVFFVLSGFLITSLLVEERERTGAVDLAGFYARRGRRLLPALLALVATVLAIGVDDLAHVAPDALATLLYVGNWAQHGDPISMAHLSHTWSLAVEVQFYFVWSMVLLLTVSRGWAESTVVLIAAGVLVARLLPLDLAGIQRGDALMAGSLLALVSFERRVTVPRWVGWGAAAVLGTFAVIGRGDNWELLVTAVAAAILLPALDRPGQLGRALASRPLVAVGRISYGLYLWHFAIGWELWPRIAGWHWLPAAALLTALSFAFAFASWRYVEQPAMRAFATAAPLRRMTVLLQRRFVPGRAP